MSFKSVLKQNRATFVSLAVLVILFIVAFAIIAALQSVETDELKAYVHDGDGNVTELNLDTDSTTMIVTSLGVNTVMVENRTVRITEADCPNHDCMRQKAISQPGEQLICLPHKLWVNIATNEEGVMDTNAVMSEDSSNYSNSPDTSGSSDTPNFSSPLDVISR